MAGLTFTMLLICVLAVALSTVRGEDPYFFFTWNVTYGTISPLGVPQQGILINGQFPGPNINSTSNNNIVVNVFNNLDEPFLLHWSGVQHRKNSWQDGLLGTNCPIPPGTNFTYHFQVKDQIGSFFYYPSTALHRAGGAFGGLRINSRLLIPVPYADPEDDYTVLAGDWYTNTHSTLKKLLDSGRSIARPDGVLINGKTAKGDGSDEPLFTMKPGKTYKYRICNVGLKTSLNFRIQGHTMKLVEMEGSHTVQNVYQSLDVHVGQCFSVLVTADQEPKDYYMVASTRFIKNILVGKAIVRYTNGNSPVSPEIPEAPIGWAWSLNQFRTFRWNLTASAARPNPQGSYHYGSINITRTIKLLNSATRVDGKLRYAINGVSHVDPETPLKLAQYFNVADNVFKYDMISDEGSVEGSDVTIAPNVVNATYRNFVEIVFENHEKSVQSWHLDGYSFFAVAIEPGRWSPEKRKNYNLLDAVHRHTIQVFPKSWAAVLVTLDNAGMWNLRSELTENRYLGQQLYFSVLSPANSLRDEYNIPDNTLLCGLVKDMPLPKPYTI
ncbi:L-ascorbate oxidase homolog [Cucurbita pepo subsp. pepo]|uniref:L-ascorbate oxidase homolog n=1 Tax=Cucurbita pepo subsp. pepo TaxID=3664 RepID=UPI000C9DA55C|nr:L-ascorbate oxidase homolog [Cucurbita pepo subsp. pepo]